MKRLRLHAALAGGTLLLSGASLHAQLPAVETRETTGGLVVRADFDGDGDADVAIVDGATGNFYTLQQQPGGTFTKRGPYASGLGSVTGAAAGRVESTGRAHLVVTSPDANRLSVVDALPAGGSSPVARPVFPTSLILGTKTVATGDEVGSSASYDDFAIGGSLNSPPTSSRNEILRVASPGLYASTTNIGFYPGVPRQSSRSVVKASLGNTVTWLVEAGGVTDLRTVAMGITGSPTVLTIAGLGSGEDYAMAPFNGEALSTLFTYVPGSTTLTARRLQEPALNTFSVLSSAPIALSQPVRSVTVVPTGPASNALLLVSGDGSTARTYSYTAPATLSLLGTHLLDPGEGVFGAISLTGLNGFQLLTGDLASGRISSSRIFRWNGSAFEQTQRIDGLDFNSLGGLTNIFLFPADPFINPGVSIIARMNARDWTSGAPPVPPGNVIVNAETFSGASLGLSAGAAVDLGAFPAGASYALLSQYRSNISVFGLSKPSGGRMFAATITPASGTYDTSVQVRISAPAGMTIYYRMGANSGWQLYTDPGDQPAEQSDPAYATWLADALPLMVFRPTTVQAFATGPGGRTDIATVTYAFTSPPDTLSSLNDGVPDYVKIGKGYNPFLQPPNPDSAGDTTEGDDPQSYLQRILADAGHSIPNRNTTPGAYTLHVGTFSHDGNLNPLARGKGVPGEPVPPSALPDGTLDYGNTITARTFSGAALDSATVLSTGPFAYATAGLTKLTADPASSLIVLGTLENFALEGTLPPSTEPSRRGRSMFRIYPAPTLPPNPFNRAYTFGSNLSEANAWISGAAAHYSSVPYLTEAHVDTWTTTAGLIFERWLQSMLVRRGVLPATFDPTAPGYTAADRVSVTPHRAIEGATPFPAAGVVPSGVLGVTTAQVFSLEQYVNLYDPGFRLSQVIGAIDAALRVPSTSNQTKLQSLALEVQRISAAYAGRYPGALDQPIDVLRQFVMLGTLPAAYTRNNPMLTPAQWGVTPVEFTSLSDTDHAEAYAGVQEILNLIQPRPVAEFDLVVIPGGVTSTCTVLERHLLGGQYSLFNADGTAFAFPTAFDLIPGVRITVLAYTDATFAGCAGTSLEVISVDGVPFSEVAVIPAASASDADGNLLGDEWELAFFGQTGADPFAIPGGDGYTTLQKYLEGKDPLVFASYAEFAPVELGLPEVTIEPGAPGFLTLRMSWPTTHFSQLKFRIQRNANLANPAGWADVGVSFSPSGADEFIASVPYAGGNAFWRVIVSLP